MEQRLVPQRRNGLPPWRSRQRTRTFSTQPIRALTSKRLLGMPPVVSNIVIIRTGKVCARGERHFGLFDWPTRFPASDAVSVISLLETNRRGPSLWPQLSNWLAEAQFVPAVNNMCGYMAPEERQHCSSPMLPFMVRQYAFISEPKAASRLRKTCTRRGLRALL